MSVKLEIKRVKGSDGVTYTLPDEHPMQVFSLHKQGEDTPLKIYDQVFDSSRVMEYLKYFAEKHGVAAHYDSRKSLTIIAQNHWRKNECRIYALTGYAQALQDAFNAEFNTWGVYEHIPATITKDEEADTAENSSDESLCVKFRINADPNLSEAKADAIHERVSEFIHVFMMNVTRKDDLKMVDHSELWTNFKNMEYDDPLNPKVKKFTLESIDFIGIPQKYAERFEDAFNAEFSAPGAE